MDKIKINLLPKEVLEKRKAEQRLAFMFLGLVVMVAVLALAFGYNSLRISSEAATLEIIKAENEQVQQQISKIASFETDKALVDKQEAAVNTAIAGKYSWSRFLNNISLIIPNEVWLKSLSIAPDKTMSFSGSAMAGTSTSNSGHKPVAKWLIHLAELKEIDAVWLTQSTKTGGAASAGSTLGPSSPTSSTPESKVLVEFETTAKIKSPSQSTPSAPAPPAPGGQT